MNIFQDIKTGINALLAAFRFIHKHKWYAYTLLPAVFMILLYRLGYFISTNEPELTAETTNGITWLIIYGFIEIGLGLVLMDFTKYLIVIVLSPLLTYLSATTDRMLTKKKTVFSFSQFINDIKRAVKLALRNMLWQYSILGLMYTIGTLIWGEVAKSPIVILMYLTSFFYYGFSFMDYTLERLKFGMNESIAYVRKHRALALIIGATYSLLILVPVNLDILFSLEGFRSNGFWPQLIEFCWHLILWLSASFAPILVIVMATLSILNRNTN